MSDFVVAESMIRQLHARYADAVWRKDYDAFADCFAEDAEWRVAGGIMRGRAEIVAKLKRVFLVADRVLMTFRTPILDAARGVVSGRTYVTEDTTFKDGRPGFSIGLYYEHFIDEGDRWRFKWRLFQTHYFGRADLSGPIFENPGYGPPPGMPPSDAESPDHVGISTRMTAP